MTDKHQLHPGAARYCVMGMVRLEGGSATVGNPEDLPIEQAGGRAAVAEFITTGIAADELTTTIAGAYGVLGIYDEAGRMVQGFGIREQGAFDRAVTTLNVPPYEPPADSAQPARHVLTARDILADRQAQHDDSSTG